MCCQIDRSGELEQDSTFLSMPTLRVMRCRGGPAAARRAALTQLCRTVPATAPVVVGSFIPTSGVGLHGRGYHRGRTVTSSVSVAKYKERDLVWDLALAVAGQESSGQRATRRAGPQWHPPSG